MHSYIYHSNFISKVLWHLIYRQTKSFLRYDFWPNVQHNVKAGRFITQWPLFSYIVTVIIIVTAVVFGTLAFGVVFLVVYFVRKKMGQTRQFVVFTKMRTSTKEESSTLADQTEAEEASHNEDTCKLFTDWQQTLWYKELITTTTLFCSNN